MVLNAEYHFNNFKRKKKKLYFLSHWFALGVHCFYSFEFNPYITTRCLCQPLVDGNYRYHIDIEIKLKSSRIRAKCLRLGSSSHCGLMCLSSLTRILSQIHKSHKQTIICKYVCTTQMIIPFCCSAAYLFNAFYFYHLSQSPLNAVENFFGYPIKVDKI